MVYLPICSHYFPLSSAGHSNVMEYGVIDEALGLFMKVGIFGVKTSVESEKGPTPTPLIEERM
jgi:hypothetical protein